MSTRSAVVALAAVLVIAGCSGGDDSTAAPSSSGPPPTTAAPTTVPPTTVPATTAPPTTVEPYAEWCSLAVRAEDVSKRGDDVDYTDPAEVKAFFEEYIPLLEEARGVAPVEIADEVATTADIAGRLATAVAAADYDMFTAELSFVDDVQAERDAAGDEIEAFNAEHCGIPIDPNDDESSDGEFSFGDGTLRDQFVGRLLDQGFTADEAECVYDNLDFSDLESLDDGATAAVFEACDISLERLGEINNTISGSDMWADVRVALDDAGVPADQIDCVVDDLGAQGATDVGPDSVLRAIAGCGVNIVSLSGEDLPPVDDVETAVGDILVEFGVPIESVACVTPQLDLTDVVSAFEPAALAAALDACDEAG